MKKNGIVLCLVALCNLTLLAQTQKSFQIVHTEEKSAIHIPPQETPAGLKVIYTNLGKKTDLYDDTNGWTVQGPAITHYSLFVAVPFTPKSDSQVSQVGAALQYIYGANQVNLSIYGDSSGAPGALLAGPVTVTNLPSYTCCTLGVAVFTPVAVTAGTQYWVVADTPLTGTGSDFFGAWDMVPKIVPIALNDNSGGWFATTAVGLPAVEVLGTIP